MLMRSFAAILCLLYVSVSTVFAAAHHHDGGVNDQECAACSWHYDGMADQPSATPALKLPRIFALPRAVARGAAAAPFRNPLRVAMRNSLVQPAMSACDEVAGEAPKSGSRLRQPPCRSGSSAATRRRSARSPAVRTAVVSSRSSLLSATRGNSAVWLTGIDRASQPRYATRTRRVVWLTP